ncbi:hypothetical protein A3D85_02835 [Candidatus Amesbacteria bacterium RIFCSPHIGHO2_02_FULL_47_9]|uniref:Uncharacterized protein n=1 Tax=Candidatus Amesbacteria bacterium RIFCSPHIGHO2_01_FULL_48_32b TaxID=1797253 RepID=A0A1F4YH20_9BACT|nr:MAG: hypothetical protein A2876_04895 [Candidatus Amesbacteria bacterium RIFCSPHIGHO2_01_FULL_48_32b]OGD03555.1 MAG: hypothetical protein A3D85_02835 [Candidatus Amesbacteria bacterium RIFCSPHIGHO2_02_FULL_47_9]OGD07033.1 MAG: hypothetical protein A2899_00150 [Candidatus Amesbacteria bacterium RIFCSPLOWO2_01_FULL_49_25]
MARPKEWLSDLNVRRSSMTRVNPGCIFGSHECWHGCAAELGLKAEIVGERITTDGQVDRYLKRVNCGVLEKAVKKARQDGNGVEVDVEKLYERLADVRADIAELDEKIGKAKGRKDKREVSYLVKQKRICSASAGGFVTKLHRLGLGEDGDGFEGEPEVVD